MRYAPRAILAGGLGFAVSCVAACGGGAGLLSGDQSIALSGQGNEIASAVQSGNCGAAINASRALGGDVQNLPVTVNQALRHILSDGAATIAQLAATDCRQHTTTAAPPPTTTSSTSSTQSTSSTTTPTTSTSTTSTTTSSSSSTTPTSATTPTNTGTSNTTTSGGVGLGGGTTTGTGSGGGTTGGAGAGNGNSGGGNGGGG